MNNKFIVTLLSCLFVSLMYYTPNANASGSTDTNAPITLASDTITYGVTIEYSLKDYCINPTRCTSKQTLLPTSIWVERSGGYAGYIPIDSYHVSATHWVVYYWGTLKRAPYVPTQIDEDM